MDIACDVNVILACCMESSQYLILVHFRGRIKEIQGAYFAS